MKIALTNLGLVALLLLITANPERAFVQNDEPAHKTQESQKQAVEGLASRGGYSGVRRSIGQDETQEKENQHQKLSDSDVYSVKIVSQPNKPTDLSQTISDIVAAIAAIIAGFGVALTAKQLRLDQRAWIGIDNISGELKVGEPYTIEITLRNFGRTPARYVETIYTSAPVEQGEKINFSHDQVNEESTRSLLTPHAHQYIRIRVLDKVEENYIAGITSGKYRYAVYGTVTYQDIFKKKHWLTFYFWLHSNCRNYNIGPEHNDTGDGNPPRES